MLFALSLSIGIALGHLFYFMPGWTVPLACVPYVLWAAFAARGEDIRVCVRILCGALFLMLGVFLYDTAAADEPLPEKAGLLTGRIVASERLQNDLRRYTLADVRLYSADTGWVEAAGQGQLYASYTEGLPGQSIRANDVWISKEKGVRNPGGRSGRLQMWTHGSSFFVSTDEPIVFTGKEDTFDTFWMRARENVTDRITWLFPDRTDEAIMQALLLGNFSKLEQELSDAFSMLGITHALAVSGLHVTFIILPLMGLFRLTVYAFPRRYGYLWQRFALLRVALICAVLWAYAAMVGFAPSIVRAVVMTAALLLARATGRGRDNANTIALAAIVVLLMQPMDLFSISFQLSFGAVIGIALYAERMQSALNDARLPKALGMPERIQDNIRFPRFFTSSIGVTMAAQLGIMPFLARSFGRLPLLGLLANLFAVPLSGAAVMGGIVTVALSYLWPEGAAIAAIFPAVCVRMLCRMSVASTNIPIVSVEVAAPSYIMMAAYFALFLLAAPIIRKRRLRLWRAAVAVCAGVMGAALVFWGLWCFPIQAEATVLDAGYGQAIIVRQGDAMALIDGGLSAGAALNASRYYGRAYDAVVLTGSSGDRVGALIDLLQKNRVKAIYAPPEILSAEPLYETLILAHEKGVPVYGFMPGESVNIGNLYVKRLEAATPSEGAVPVAYSLEGQDGKSRMLITGALTAAQENLFDFPQTVLLVGSARASIQSGEGKLLWNAQPQIAVLPVSSHSGEADLRALESLRLHAPSVYRTDQSGAVTVRFADAPLIYTWGRER